MRVLILDDVPAPGLSPGATAVCVSARRCAGNGVLMVARSAAALCRSTGRMSIAHEGHAAMLCSPLLSSDTAQLLHSVAFCQLGDTSSPVREGHSINGVDTRPIKNTIPRFLRFLYVAVPMQRIWPSS